MGIINLLDTGVSNLIAAGEVVERPASAIKELCENSIDAGARNITVEIKNGGVSFMRVTDDGCGMSGEDATLCIRRHATSKIHDAKDLDSILTLGFRGEALAAISAVTRFRIITKKRGEVSGITLECDHGANVTVSECGCPEGTTVIAEELFLTTPARLKFLKTNSAEASAVGSVMERIAVSHPEISFKFISDGEIKFSSPGDGDSESAIYSVFGRSFSNGLIKAEGEYDGIGVSGYISSPEASRGNRGMQIMFLNRRIIKSKSITAALENAYRTYIPHDKFPCCVLNISVNPMLVDVNIHPSKAEVKFSNEKAVFDSVYYTVKSILEQRLKTATWNINEDIHEKPAVIAVEAEPIVDIPRELPQKKREYIQPLRLDIPTETQRKIDTGALKVSSGVSETPGVSNMPYRPSVTDMTDLLGRYDSIKQPSPVYKTDAGISGMKENEIPEYRIIGELFDTYIIIQTEDKVIFADKHAVHERINFEILRANISKTQGNTQLLMIPESIELDADAVSALSEYGEEIAAAGFIYGIRSNTVELTGIPNGIETEGARGLFLSLVSALEGEPEAFSARKRVIFEKALYQTACKMSVKGGRVYNEEHIRWICDNLFRYDCVKFCPHGRPVAYEIAKKEFDRHFYRI